MRQHLRHWWDLWAMNGTLIRCLETEYDAEDIS